MTRSERLVFAAMIGLLLCSSLAMWWTTSLAVPSSTGQTAADRERIKRERHRRGRGDACDPGCDCSPCLDMGCDALESAACDGCDPSACEGCDLPCDCATASPSRPVARVCRPGGRLANLTGNLVPLLGAPAVMLWWRRRLRRRGSPDRR